MSYEGEAKWQRILGGKKKTKFTFDSYSAYMDPPDVDMASQSELEFKSGSGTDTPLIEDHIKGRAAEDRRREPRKWCYYCHHSFFNHGTCIRHMYGEGRSPAVDGNTSGWTRCGDRQRENVRRQEKGWAVLKERAPLDQRPATQRPEAPEFETDSDEEVPPPPPTEGKGKGRGKRSRK